MSSACQIPDEQLCGCCAGVTRETPQLINNRPALSAVVYRVGTYGTFDASMLSALSRPSLPALGRLRTRDSSDFSIALLDAWAVALDILTFYQERFANEAYLRTAVEQRSVFELARLVGYMPSPGVAASDVLAFTLSSAPGSPDNVLIPAGTRVQSVPRPGQKPQVFETAADLTAVIAYNALPAQTTIPWQLFAGSESTWIVGTANNIHVGDVLLFISASAGTPSGTGPAEVRYVTAVSIDSNSQNTHIFWDQPLSGSFPANPYAPGVGIYIFRKKAALFGVQAPNPWTLATDQTKVKTLPGYPTVDGSDWTFQYTEYSNQISLDAAYPGLAPASGEPQWIVLTGEGYTSFFQIVAASEINPNLYTLSTKTTQLTLAMGQILSGDTALSLNEVLWSFVQETRGITAYVQSQQLTPVDLPLTPPYVSASLLPPYGMQPGMVLPVQGTFIAVKGGQMISGGQPVGVTGKRARLRVGPGAGATFEPAGTSSTLTVADNQVFVIDSYPPATDPASGNLLWTVLTTSGVEGALIAGANFVELLPADKNDPLAGESTLVDGVSVAGDYTLLQLHQSLARIYDAATLTVNANAVNATNGETMQEILGSGDATNDALEFTLRQSPLTYLSAPVGNGVQSTLAVWVNNLEWHEVPNFLSSGPADRVFVTRVNQAGNMMVQFGNGVQGARTPTGQSNIRAVYRKGIGQAGMVDAGQLSLPLDRPQGLKSVSNPSPASGAADPASAADARASAPLPTLTLNRIVSLEDYQNYALAFAGIAKALASWTWFGTTRGVFLTVAGEGGSVLQPDDPLMTNLVQAIKSFGNPYVPLQVASYVPRFFQFTASLKIDTTDYAPPLVLAQVWANLTSAFDFSQRQFGQGVVASEIIELIQQTPGVIALELQALNYSGDSASLPPNGMLVASAPIPGQNTPPQPAQMLLLDPATFNNIGAWS